MKNLIKIVIASAIAFSSVNVNAALIATDYKESGDGLSTLDEQTGLEWLDLTQTQGMSIADIQNQLSSNFSGWRLPTKEEVNELVYNGLGIYSGDSSGTYNGGSSSWNMIRGHIKLLGETYFTRKWSYSRGLYLNNEDHLGLEVLYNDIQAVRNGIVDGNINFNYGYSSSLEAFSHQIGVYLVSDGGTTLSSINNPSLNSNNASAPINQVPLPATLGLLGLAMAGLSFGKKSKVK